MVNTDPLPLFESEQRSGNEEKRPLADRMRPSSWKEYQGIAQLGETLSKQLLSGKGRPPSLILWGPPGSGKTTVAKLIGETFSAHFVELSAVLGGVKEIRAIISAAKHRSQITILFIDEVHRFNKSQQDAFLPHIEDGTVIFIGATTENPSFALNSALLSRAKVVTLAPLSHEALEQIILSVEQKLKLSFEEDAKELLVAYGAGDARRMLNLIDGLLESGVTETVGSEAVKALIGDSHALEYDRDGDEHYNLASAFIKSLRGTDPDAALYWGFRMLASGEDPRFLFRRLMIFASEDIGNADPRALQLAVSAAEAYERLGLPEGEIPLAQCITYLASAPKSNRSYAAMGKVKQIIRECPRGAVPLHLRNAPTKLMKSLEYGKDYQYPHNTDDGYAAGVQYLPDELVGQRFYEPSEHGLEGKIKEKLEKMKQRIR